MSWVNTVLDIGILSMQASQKHKLDQMQSQQVEAAFKETLVQALREYIFKYKQAADEVLQAEEQNPLVAAGAMRVLEARLIDFGIAPEMFPEISDKEYVASTMKHIRENAARMTNALAVEEQTAVSNVVDAAQKLPEYNYYLENRDDVLKYSEAQKAYNSLKFINNGCVIPLSALLLFWLIPTVIAAIGGLIGGIFGDSGAVVLGLLGWLAGFVLNIVAMFQIRNKVTKPKEFKEAKKIVKEYEGKVDVDEFQKVEAKLGQDVKAIRKLQADAQTILSIFFGDSTINQLLPA